MMIFFGILGLLLILVVDLVLRQNYGLITARDLREAAAQVAATLAPWMKPHSRQVERADKRRRELKRIRKEHRRWPRERVRDLAIRGIEW